MTNWTLTKFVIGLFILYSANSYGRDDRVSIKVYRFSYVGESYDLYVVDIDPYRWDEEPLTDLETFRRHFADLILRQTHTFLRQRHEQDGKTENRSPLDQLILQSFERYPDPFGRLQWSDSGRHLHKVDDYFDRRTLALVVTKAEQLRPETVIGTTKYMIADPEKLLTPLVGELKGFLPFAFTVEERVAPEEVTIEWENLARKDSGPNPVPLLFKLAADHPFFATDLDTTSIHLNCEDDMVSYHERFGFRIVPGFFTGLPAKRMMTQTRTYRESIALYAQEKLSLPPAKDGILRADNMREILWTERAEKAGLRSLLKKENHWNQVAENVCQSILK